MTEAISGRRVRLSDLMRGSPLARAQSDARYFRSNRPGGVLVRIPEASAREMFNIPRVFYVAREGDVAPDGVTSKLDINTLGDIPLKRFVQIHSDSYFSVESLGRVIPVRLRSQKDMRLLVLGGGEYRVRKVLDCMQAGLSEGATMRITDDRVDVPSFMVNRVAKAISLLTDIPYSALGYSTYQGAREMSLGHMDGARWIDDQLFGNASFVEALRAIGITSFWFSAFLSGAHPVFGSRLYFDFDEAQRHIGPEGTTAPGVRVASGNAPLYPLVLELGQPA
ncbi:MAG: hypothetical protein WC901_00500 [Candidatus Margulisiibacteriota bacterium]